MKSDTKKNCNGKNFWKDCQEFGLEQARLPSAGLRASHTFETIVFTSRYVHTRKFLTMFSSAAKPVTL